MDGSMDEGRTEAGRSAGAREGGKVAAPFSLMLPSCPLLPLPAGGGQRLTEATLVLR